MLDLADTERTTLEQLIARPPVARFDGAVLTDLASRELIDFGIQGWRVTPLGRAALTVAGSARPDAPGL